MRNKLPPIPKFKIPGVEEEKPRRGEWTPPPWDHELTDNKGNTVRLMRTKILGQRIVYTVEEQQKAMKDYTKERGPFLGVGIGDRGMSVCADKNWHESGFGTIIAHMGTYQFEPKPGEVVPKVVTGKRTAPGAVPHIFFLCEEYDARKRASKRASSKKGLAFANPLSS